MRTTSRLAPRPRRGDAHSGGAQVTAHRVHRTPIHREQTCAPHSFVPDSTRFRHHSSARRPVAPHGHPAIRHAIARRSHHRDGRRGPHGSNADCIADGPAGSRAQPAWRDRPPVPVIERGRCRHDHVPVGAGGAGKRGCGPDADAIGPHTGSDRDAGAGHGCAATAAAANGGTSEASPTPSSAATGPAGSGHQHAAVYRRIGLEHEDCRRCGGRPTLA